MHDNCLNCRHSYSAHITITNKNTGEPVVICRPKILGFATFCGCQKYRGSDIIDDPRETEHPWSDDDERNDRWS